MITVPQPFNRGRVQYQKEHAKQGRARDHKIDESCCVVCVRVRACARTYYMSKVRQKSMEGEAATFYSPLTSLSGIGTAVPNPDTLN